MLSPSSSLELLLGELHSRSGVRKEDFVGGNKPKRCFLTTANAAAGDASNTRRATATMIILFFFRCGPLPSVFGILCQSTLLLVAGFLIQRIVHVTPRSPQKPWRGSGQIMGIAVALTAPTMVTIYHPNNPPQVQRRSNTQDLQRTLSTKHGCDTHKTRRKSLKHSMAD